MNGRVTAILLAASMSPGSALAAWTEFVQLNTESDGFSQGNPDIARGPGPTANGTLFVVWEGNQVGGGNFDIYIRCSTDGGISWSGPTRLTSGADLERRPRVATAISDDGTTIRLAISMEVGGAKDDIGIIRQDLPVSPDPCAAITAPATPLVLAENLVEGNGLDLDVDQEGNIYLAYYSLDGGGPSNDGIYFGRLLAAPITVLDQVKKVSLNDPTLGRPEIIAAGNIETDAQVVIAYHGDSRGHITLNASTNGGVAFNYALVNTAGVKEFPRIDFHKFKKMVPPVNLQVWMTFQRDAADVYTGIYDVEAVTEVQAPVKVNTTIINAGQQAISALPNVGKALVTFVANNGGTDLDVYASESTNTGASWSSPEEVIAESGGAATTVAQRNPRPAIGLSQGGVGSTYVIAESEDQGGAADAEPWFSKNTATGVTANRVDQLVAEWQGGNVAVSWVVVRPDGVTWMQVVEASGDAVGSALVPGLDDTYQVTDPDPGRDPRYTLEILLEDGTLEQYGPVSPTEGGTGRAGCGRGSVFALLLGGFLRISRRRDFLHFLHSLGVASLGCHKGGSER